MAVEFGVVAAQVGKGFEGAEAFAAAAVEPAAKSAAVVAKDVVGLDDILLVAEQSGFQPGLPAHVGFDGLDGIQIDGLGSAPGENRRVFFIGTHVKNFSARNIHGSKRIFI